MGSMVVWNAVEGRGDLAGALQGAPSSELVVGDPDRWGFFQLQSGWSLAVGYRNLGLAPAAVMHDGHVFVGINEALACYDCGSWRQEFLYTMPTVFHEFIEIGARTIVRDEIGFVCITPAGNERWKFLTSGPIAAFSFDGVAIRGKTIDGDLFRFDCPDGNTESLTS